MRKIGKVVLGIAVVAVAIGALSGNSDDEEQGTSQASETAVSTAKSPLGDSKSGQVSSPSPQRPKESKGQELTLQQQNAVKSAQNYVDLMPFSKSGLIKQLSSTYGEGYPVEDARLAVTLIDVDWFAEAVEAAEGYQEFLPMSRDGLIQQLTSEAGDGFTQKQAVHAADTLGL